MSKFGLRSLLAVALLCGASWAHAAFHLFRIDQIYSNADGTVQFIVLKECCGTNGENQWDGLALRSGAQVFNFPNNLPTASTANRSVLVGTQGLQALGVINLDFVVPNNFVPIGGGTVNYAGVSQVTFGPLPTDGTNAINAQGMPVPNLARNLQGQAVQIQPPAATPTALAVEFYNASLDHYFLSHIAQEISDLDTGVHVGWTRTGQSFRVFTAASAQTSPVCRYYIPPAKGDSHFYGRGVQECTETGQKNPTFVNEDAQFFFVILPVGGVCPAGTIPVYRVFDNRTDANHRYMIDINIRNAMVSQQHWIAEGDGPDLVVMCVPPTTPASAPTPAPPPPEPPMPDPMPPYGPPGYGGGY